MARLKNNRGPSWESGLQGPNPNRLNKAGRKTVKPSSRGRRVRQRAATPAAKAPAAFAGTRVGRRIADRTRRRNFV